MKWCPVAHRSEKVEFKRLKLKMSLLCITKATTSKTPLKRTCITKRFPKKRNGCDDGACRSKNELDQWQREIKHRNSCAQGNKGKRRQVEQRNTGELREQEEQREGKTGEEGKRGKRERKGTEATRGKREKR